jgi:hypothetical protein
MYVFPHRLTGDHYPEIHLHDLTKLLGNLPVAVRSRIWCKQDGVQAQVCPSLRGALSNTHHDR